MPRGANFYYQGDQQLGASLGASLGRALFGDPEAAAKLALQRAQMENYAANAEESRAHAGLYGKQGEGVEIQNTASRGLPDLFASMFPTPAPAAVPAAPAGEPDTSKPYYPAAPEVDMGALRQGLPALIASMAQMQGDKVNMPDAMQVLGAFMGGDEMARRGMVAGGHTPGKEFAITPDRADDIAKQGYDAEYNKGTAVARINHASDIPVENIRSGDRRYATDKASGDRRYSTDVASSDRTYAVDNKNYDRAGAIALGNSLGTVTSTVRTAKHNKDVGGVSNSWHLDSRGGRGIDIQRKPGVSHAQVVQSFRDRGFTILEQLDEGDHSHLALGGGPGAAPKGGAKAKAPKQVSPASAKLINSEITNQVAARGWAQTPDAGTMARIREAAFANYQRSGNPAAAASAALDEVKRRFDAKQGKPAAKQAGAPNAGKPGPDQLRQQALTAIGKGADPAQVRARFKQMTGQELKGV